MRTRDSARLLSRAGVQGAGWREGRWSGFAVFRGEEGVDAEAIAREADHDGVVAHPILRSVSRLAAKGLKWEGGLT